jgi:hypothetical protein
MIIAVARPAGDDPVTNAQPQSNFTLPEGAEVAQVGGRGPFVSRLRFLHPDGGTVTWDSREARKRGVIEVVRDGVVDFIRTRPTHAVRLGRCNTVSGISFAIGGALFTLGAVLSGQDVASILTIDFTFLVGGLFFSLGAYAALVQEINSPRGIGKDGLLHESRWRWWAYEPMRPGWVAAFVLLCGTLAFAISLIDAFGQNLDTQQLNRLIWAPEIVGCVLFLVSGHIGILEVCHGRFRLMPRSLGWWIVIVNQVGSWLFMLSGLAAFVRPATGDLISPVLVNWGTALGAACFSLAGIAQLFERPAAETTRAPAATEPSRPPG